MVSVHAFKPIYNCCRELWSMQYALNAMIGFRGAFTNESAESCSLAVAQYFDGGSRGNPGTAGCGAVVFFDPQNHDSLRNPNSHITAYSYLGVATNNDAEYEGLLLGLLLAYNAGVTRLNVRGDSQLVINQLTGAYNAREPRLQRLLSLARQMLRRFRHGTTSEHVYREMNRVADTLSNDAMDSHRIDDVRPSHEIEDDPRFR